MCCKAFIGLFLTRYSFRPKRVIPDDLKTVGLSSTSPRCTYIKISDLYQALVMPKSRFRKLVISHVYIPSKKVKAQSWLIV